MSFLFAAGLALVLEIAGPLVAMALVEWRLRPRAAAGVWAAGIVGIPVGGLLFLAALLMLDLFVPSSPVAPGLDWLPLVSFGLREGLLVGWMEECVRFAAAAVLFRRASGRPLVAGALFGLGWGGAEIVLVLLRQIPALSLQLELYRNAGAVPMPFASLLAPAERLGAMLLHVALSGFAVASAMAISRGAPARATALLAAAIAVHSLLDAWVLVMFRLYAAALDAGNASGIVVLEAVFVAGAAAVLVAARRFR